MYIKEVPFEVTLIAKDAILHINNNKFNSYHVNIVFLKSLIISTYYKILKHKLFFSYTKNKIEF